MRVFLAITLLILLVPGAPADDPETDESIPWQEPFEAISASRSADALVLVLITNEDPFLAAESTREAQRDRRDKAVLNPPVWCAEVLGRSYREAMEKRQELRNRITVQSIVAGLPKELTGGQERNTPSRAVLAICDGNYRLLSVMVGVPNVGDLLTLIEDAEDVATMRQLDSEHPSRVVAAIAQRSSQRLSRLWRGVLEEMVVAMQGDAGGDESDVAVNGNSLAGRLQLLSETFDPTYFTDAQLRFGLSDRTDQTRMVVLEQHPQTRRPWCEAMIPFAAGNDFTETWRELVELIWGHQPITADAEAKELVDWFDVQTKTETIVLSLRPPLRMRHLSWPPIVDQGLRRGIGWREVHARAIEHPFRSVNAQQLAILIRSRELKAVDIQQPSMARYLLIEPKKKTAYTAREADPPGRFAGLLKRSKSNLVKE